MTEVLEYGKKETHGHWTEDAGAKKILVIIIQEDFSNLMIP
jgi:hypothetical protein